MNRKWTFLVALSVALALVASACGSTPAPPNSVPEAETSPLATPQVMPGAGEQSSAPPAAEQPAPQYAALAIPEAGLAIEVPGNWQRLAPQWSWSPDPAGSVRVGLAWTELQPPMEPEAALLPTPSQILESGSATLGWATGRRVTVEVYAPAEAGGDEKAPVASVETHVLAVTSEGGVRRGYDFYAAAPTAKELAGLDPVLEHMVASAQLLDNSAGSPAPSEGKEQPGDVASKYITAEPPAGVPLHPDWQEYDNPTYGISLWHPTDWKPVPGYDDRLGGPDGFFEVAAMGQPGLSLDQVCSQEAEHKLQPYGSRPTVTRTTLRGQDGCFVLPSADQPAAMEHQAALIVAYPQPIEIGGQLYAYVVLWADEAHIEPIAQTMGFVAPGR